MKRFSCWVVELGHFYEGVDSFFLFHEQVHAMEAAQNMMSWESKGSSVRGFSKPVEKRVFEDSTEYRVGCAYARVFEKVPFSSVEEWEKSK